MADYLKISGGTVYDPANGIDGEVRDLWIAGRQDRRGADRSGRAARRATIDASGPGRHARRRRHALPHRRAEGERRPQDAARGKTQGASAAPHGQHAQRHDGQRAQHVCHRLQVRRHGLHDGLRRRHSAARRPARPRGICGHALHRQGLLRPDGQQPLRHAVRSSRTSRRS